MEAEHLIQFLVFLSLVVFGLLLLRLGAFVLGLPLRRRENSRLFLNLLETGLRDGRRPEDVLLSCARAKDRSVEFLATPRTPRVLGLVHLLLGSIGLIFTVIILATLIHEYPSSWIEDEETIWLRLGLLWDGLNIWAGVQLMRYRPIGRWLSIGIAVVCMVLSVVSAIPASDGGWYVDIVFMLCGMVLPFTVIYLLTNPVVAAAFGRDGQQESLLVTRLREMDLVDALRQVPGIIEPRIVSLLAVGRELGDLQKVLPACRTVLGEATDKARAAQNHFVLLVLVVMPGTLAMLPFLAIYIIPKFNAIMADMGVEGGVSFIFDWFLSNLGLVASLHGLVLLLLWAFTLAFVGGPRLETSFARRLPGLASRVALILPWRRKRAQRDFSISMALLLDAGLPEARAVELAAESTGNQIFQERARQVVADLANGMALAEAVGRIDGSGEFQWRLTTAAKAGRGFLPALRAWHETLDARAAQQEQAASQMATTSLVFYNGAIVGLVMFGVFQFLISILDSAALW